MLEKFKRSKGKFSYKSLVQILEKELGEPLSKRAKTALKEAFEGHRGQFRESKFPGQGLPYITHSVGVTRLVIKYLPLLKNLSDDLDVVICTALLHDLLEDTAMSGSRIKDIAGAKVQAYVEALTKPPAGVAGKSKEKRYQEFLNRIIKAGPTTAFIKVCDDMHNLTRPATKPPKLLERLVYKTKILYFPLVEHFSFSDEIRKDYEKLIKAAEQTILENKKEEKLAPSPATLESAIEECVTASKGKVLELHDISDILARICQAKRIVIWRHSGEGDGLLRLVSPKLELEEQKSQPISIRALDFSESPRILTGPTLSKFSALSPKKEHSTIFTIPMRTDPKTIFVIAMGFDAKGPPVWLSLDSATMLVQFLAHRLIMAEASRRARLAGAAASLGIQLDVEMASQINIQPAELGKLQFWRNRCRQAISVVEHLINFLLLSDEVDIPLRNLVRVESRVKPVNSILKKYLPSSKRVWPEYEKLEDIAGVRVICPTRSGIQAIEQFLLSNRARAVGVRPHTAISNSRRDYTNIPTQDGYRALHLILEVETRMQNGGKQTVPCEVQLRTMFQHTWAAISHAILYRASKKLRRRYSKELKEAGRALEHFEQLTEKLTDKE